MRERNSHTACAAHDYGRRIMSFASLNPLRAIRGRQASKPSLCLVCARSVSDRDERSRLRGDVYVHRACGTYQVRSLSASGAYRGSRASGDLPGPSGERPPATE